MYICKSKVKQKGMAMIGSVSIDLLNLIEFASWSYNTVVAYIDIIISM